MSFHNSVRPVIAPHYHCNNGEPHSQPFDQEFGQNLNQPINSYVNQYNTYDPITGEYQRSGQLINANRFITGGQYIRERRQIICCGFCQKKIPVNCLTITLITCLMLLMMFSLIHLIVDANSKTAISSELLREMIWIIISVVIIITFLLIIRYFYSNRFQKFCSPEDEDERNDSFNYYSYECNEQFV